MHADAGQHLLGPKRLGDVVDCPEPKPLHLVADVFERGDEEDRDVRRVRIGLEEGAGFESVLAGHDDVEQDGVGAFPARERASGRAIKRQRRAEAFADEDPLQERRIQGQVVDNEDARGPNRAPGFRPRGHGHDTIGVSRHPQRLPGIRPAVCLRLPSAMKFIRPPASDP